MSGTGPSPAGGDPEFPSGTETILVVENDSIVQQIVSRVLGGCGYQVLTAAGADEALERCRDSSIQLALIDVVTPTAFGRELAHWLRRFQPELKVLFMSGYPGFEIVERKLLTPNDACLPKPFAADTLAQRVREMLDSAAAA